MSHGATTQGPILRLHTVTRSYRTGSDVVPVLRGVDLELPHGVLAAIRGRSGSGKTTLLNLIGGLDQPTSGEVELDGQLIGHLSDWALTVLRRRIGFVFQSFALLPTYSVYENVDLVLRIAGLASSERKARARHALRLVGLERWMHHRPDEMSGGQQQRVVIARAIATQPMMILADEPTGDLDTATAQRIFALLRHIVESNRVTIIVATHDPLIDNYAHITHTLIGGQILSQNTS